MPTYTIDDLLKNARPDEAAAYFAAINRLRERVFAVAATIKTLPSSPDLDTDITVLDATRASIDEMESELLAVNAATASIVLASNVPEAEKGNIIASLASRGIDAINTHRKTLDDFETKLRSLINPLPRTAATKNLS